MKIEKIAKAGTLDSNDITVIVEPLSTDAVEIELDSTVMFQYGESIRNIIKLTLKKHNINGVKVIVNDRGALDCTIEARLETALSRAGIEVAL